MVRSCARASRGNPGNLAASPIPKNRIPEPSESTCFTPIGRVTSRLSRHEFGLRLVGSARLFGCEVKCKMLRSVDNRHVFISDWESFRLAFHDGATVCY